MDSDHPTHGSSDAQLTALLATMREDAPPSDLEARVLTGLKVGMAATAGSVLIQQGFKAKLVGLVQSSLALKLGVVGVGTSLLVSAAGVVYYRGSHDVNSSPNAAAASYESEAPARFESPPAGSGPPAAAPEASNEAVRPRSRRQYAQATPAPQKSAKPQEPLSPTDALRLELSLVRQISSATQRGDCSEAFALIGQYRSRFPSGQLDKEVDALEAKCKGR